MSLVYLDSARIEQSLFVVILLSWDIKEVQHLHTHLLLSTTIIVDYWSIVFDIDIQSLLYSNPPYNRGFSQHIYYWGYDHFLLIWDSQRIRHRFRIDKRIIELREEYPPTLVQFQWRILKEKNWRDPKYRDISHILSLYPVSDYFVERFWLLYDKFSCKKSSNFSNTALDLIGQTLYLLKKISAN